MIEKFNTEYVILIETGKHRGLDKSKLTGYYEKHHIIPKCLGGLDEDSNYVLLTYQEHVRAHYLLANLYPGNEKIAYAYYMICNSSGLISSSKLTKDEILKYTTYILTEEELVMLENSRKIVSESISKRFSGVKKTEEHRKNISKSKLGKNNPMYGKHLTEEAKKHLSEINKGKTVSESTRKKLSEINKGRKHTEETKRKISERQLGVKRGPHSEEHRRKIAQANTGKTHSEDTKKKLSLHFSKKVIGPDGTIYASKTDCAKILGIGKTTLSRWISEKPEKGYKLL